MSSHRYLERIAPPALLVLAVFALYAQTVRYEFGDVDTSVHLTGNPHVLSGLSFDGLCWAFTNFYAASWHPLTWLSHMLDVDLFGLRPAGHMLENTAWHAANAILVLAVFVRLGLSRPFAFAGAMIFAVHPLRVESVAWIVERKDLLYTFFGLLTLLAWLSWSREPAAWKLVAAFGLYACSLMSKGMLVTLPFLILLVEFWPLGRQSLRPRRSDLVTLGFLGMALLVSGLTVAAGSAQGALMDLSAWPLGLRASNAFHSYVWYCAHSLWPSQLAFYYPVARPGPGIGASTIAVALILTITWGAWLARRRLPAALVGWFWFVGTLVPVIGIIQAGSQAHADRFVYFPGIGLTLALCYVAERELLPRLGGRVLTAVGLTCVTALGIRTWRQVETWRTSETLALHALEVTRDNTVALDLLGSYYSNNGRMAEALPLFRRALELNPTDADALLNLGTTLLRSNELGEAESVLLRATNIAPWIAEPWSNLGSLYLAQRRPDEALRVTEQALRCDPHQTLALNNRGLALEALGRLDDACAALELAVKWDPGNWGVELTLGRIYMRLDEPQKARPHFEHVLQLQPRHFDALRGLERVELASSNLAAAWALSQEALAARPGSAPALADQAWILATASSGPLVQPKRALELAERAVALGGHQAAFLDALALASAANGDFVRAIALAEEGLGSGRASDPEWARRLERRLSAYREGRVDRTTPR